METPQGREAISDSQAPNPAKFFAEWSSTNKQFSFWDKANKVNVPLPLPFAFIPLAQCVTLKGYNHKEGKSYWSNEVSNIQTDKFVVKSKNNLTKEVKTEFVGLYADIKPQLDGRANYTQSLYIAVKDNAGTLQLANLQISTSALGSWIAFCKTNDISKIAVQVASFTNEQNGAVHFTSPVYQALPITPQSDVAAAVLQKEIKAYLAEYFAKTAAVEPETQFKSPEPLPTNTGFGNQSAYQQQAVNTFGGQTATPAPTFTSPANQFPNNVPTNNQFPTNVTIPPQQHVQHQATFGGEAIKGNPFETNDAPPF